MSWDLIQLTDFHIIGDKQQAVRGCIPYNTLQDVKKDILTRACDHYVVTGDISDDGSMSSYRHVQDILSPFKDSLYFLPGNHDHPDIMTDTLCEWPHVLRTHCDIRQWRIIFLNSVESGEVWGYLNDSQMDTIHQLSISWNGHIILMFHHHCHEDAIRDSSQNNLKGLVNIDELIKSVMPFKHKLKGIFSGHTHRESKHVIQGIRCYTTPSTMHYFGDNRITMPGYRWIRFNNDTFETAVVYVQSTVK